jgi:hypothetical protein
MLFAEVFDKADNCADLHSMLKDRPTNDSRKTMRVTHSCQLEASDCCKISGLEYSPTTLEGRSPHLVI